jgi:hypothetical protein
MGGDGRYRSTRVEVGEFDRLGRPAWDPDCEQLVCNARRLGGMWTSSTDWLTVLQRSTGHWQGLQRDATHAPGQRKDDADPGTDVSNV